MDNDIRKFTNDLPCLSLCGFAVTTTEIVALQGGDPAAYINSVRERAYGSAYAANKYPRSGETAEDAILEERSKEFVGEGKRWYDIRRMKNGELAKALFRLAFRAILSRSTCCGTSRCYGNVERPVG